MSANLATINLNLPMGSIDAYIHQVNRIPMLSQEEERRLATELQQNNDLDAARKLVLAHLRYVVRIAKGYSGYGLPLADLIQEGNIGLMKAVKRFDVSIGVRLVSFAVHWIKAEIHEFVLRNWRIVKVATTKAQRKLFFNLRNAKRRLGWLQQDEVQAVAKDLGVSPADVMEMEMRMNAYDATLEPAAEDHESDTRAKLAPIDYLEDPHANPALALEENDLSTIQQEGLVDALAKLDERSQVILRRRWLTEKKSTLHDLAHEYQVSPERIRQLEQAAMKKLKHALVAVA